MRCAMTRNFTVPDSEEWAETIITYLEANGFLYDRRKQSLYSYLASCASSLTGQNYTIFNQSVPALIVDLAAYFSGLSLTINNTDFNGALAILNSTLRGGTVTAYLGQVATRTFIPGSMATTNKQFNSRCRHKATDQIASLQLVIPNWYVDSNTLAGNTYVELNSGMTPTITASVEFPAGTFTQVKFGGSASIAPPDGATIISDPVAITIAKGQFFFTRYFWNSPTGIIFTGTGSAFWGSDINNGEALQTAASGLSDMTLGGTVTDSASGFYGFHPAAIIGMTSNPALLILGDSRAIGVGVNASNSTGDYGEVCPSIGAGNIGYVNAAMYGDRADKFVASHAKRAALGLWCSHVYSQYGVNDFDLDGQTAAQLLANQQTVGGYFPGKPYFLQTVSPHANGSNTAAANATFNSQRISYNTTLRAGGIPGVVTSFDIAGITESSLNSGLWTAGDSTDFLHANSAGMNAIQASGTIGTALIHR